MKRSLPTVAAMVLVTLGGWDGSTMAADAAKAAEATMPMPALIPLDPLMNHHPTREQRLALADEIDNILMNYELPFFYPACVDYDNGGFRHGTVQEWKTFTPAQREKNLVFQTRMVWTAAEIAQRRPAVAEKYMGYARHGFAFLKDKMWDKEYGGFYGMVSEDGGPSTRAGGDKFGYGMAFGIYGCARYAIASKDPAALDLAMQAFNWMEKHAHDSVNQGYFEAYARNGKVLMDASGSFDPKSSGDQLGTRYGIKSMNTHIHILEALTVLYQASHDPLVKQRLEEMVHIVRDVITTDPPGAMNQFFTPDWKVVPYADSFGHDVETTYMLRDAAEALGQGRDPQLLKITKDLTDHALEFGWDDKLGGFWEEGNSFDHPQHSGGKIWWSQAEGLHTLLLLYDDTHDIRYWNHFLKMWQFIRTDGIDYAKGGWRFAIAPGNKDAGWKVHPTKAAYHTGRAMVNVVDDLRK